MAPNSMNKIVCSKGDVSNTFKKDKKTLPLFSPLGPRPHCCFVACWLRVLFIPHKYCNSTLGSNDATYNLLGTYILTGRKVGSSRVRVEYNISIGIYIASHHFTHNDLDIFILLLHTSSASLLLAHFFGLSSIRFYIIYWIIYSFQWNSFG